MDIKDDDENFGDENTCDLTDNWNDTGTTGCTYACPIEKPDLIITDIWSEDSIICYQIRNIGDATAPEGHNTTLFIDGEHRVSDDRVDMALEPGVRWKGCFDYDWECTPPEDYVVAFADYEEDIAEDNETNNFRAKTWKCDTTPPRIISGPSVHGVAQTSAVIIWETDEDSDSVVFYGKMAGVYDRNETDSTLLGFHNISLSGLEPSTTYNFVVQSTDASGNTVTSKDKIFESLPLPDEIDPTVSIIDPGMCQGLVTFSADASDNTGVEKVEFYLEDKLVFTDYSPPYQLLLDSLKYENGEYTLGAKAYDLAGLAGIQQIPVDINNPLDAFAPEVNITSPKQGDTVSGEIPVNVTVSDDTGIKSVEFYVDGEYYAGHVYGGHYYTERKVTFTWDTRGLAEGIHSISIVARDRDNRERSQSISLFMYYTHPFHKLDLPLHITM